MSEFKGTRRLYKMLIVSVLFLFALAVSASAQTNKATISGTVTDPQGAVVPDANVTATNNATGVTRNTVTTSTGNYEIPLLEIGTYTLTITRDGFRTVRRENITVQTRQVATVDVQLELGELTNEVVVTAEAPLIESETSERGSVVTGREVSELPLSGRNFTQLATLTPGVVRSTNVGVGASPEARGFNNGDARAGSGGPGSGNENGNTETSRFSRSGGANISANGQRPTNNNFSLDGVDNNEPQFGTIGVFTNPDSIAEFKVSTSIPPAEVGRAAGAVVTVTTKSGGNDFSGSLYYYGQNSALNAYSPVLKTRLGEAIGNNTNQDGINALQKAVQQIHEFGGTLGGPIIKDRTFFFFDYLGQRNNLPFPAATIVPTAQSRAGNFSEFASRDCDGDGMSNGANDGPVCDPRTGRAFANNTLPANLLDPVGSAYFNAFPLPTRTGVIDPNQGRENFFTQRSNEEQIDGYRIRIDHRFSDKNFINGSYNDQRQKNTRANLLPGLPTAGFGAGEERNNTRAITLNDIHTFKPNLLNEFRFGYTEIQISIFNCGVGGACGVSPTFASDIGIPNVNDGSVESSGGALIGNFGTGFTEFTGDGGLFQVKSKNPYFADTVTFIKGDHTLKFGGEIRLRYLNTIDGGRSGGLKGNFQFGDTLPQVGPNANCPAASQAANGCYVRPDGTPYGGTGNGQANILLGIAPRTITVGEVFGGPFDLRSQEYGFFIQDDWKVNDRLTLNLGLRYDLFTPFSESNGRYSLYNIEQRQVVVANGGGDRIVETDKNNFGPRIGFAYGLNKEKTLVLRGGYGLLYTLDGVDYPPGVRNAPFSNTITLNQREDFGNGRIAEQGTVFTLSSGPPTVPQNIDPANIPQSFGVFAIDQEQKNGMVHQFQVSMQYQFADDYSIDVGYVGNRSRNLLYTNNIGSGGTAEALNSNGDFLFNAALYTNGAKSKYDALQVQLQKRLSNNFQGQISYTFSDTKDNSVGVFNGLGDQRQDRLGPLNPFDLSLDYGNSSLDVPHLLSANVIIDLPFGKDQKFANQGGVVDKLVGGWQMNWIVTARSGLPFSVVANQIGRPSLIGDPFANVPDGLYLNPAAFSTTEGITTVTNDANNTISFGNLERNAFRGPNLFFADMSLFKNTSITERVRTQLGIEFYNVFNRANYTVPNNNINNGDFGQIKFNAYPGRVIQYRLKLLF